MDIANSDGLKHSASVFTLGSRDFAASVESSCSDAASSVAPSPSFDLVVVANRLPVAREADDQGASAWTPSPGGLAAAMEAAMRHREGAWVGWAGDCDEVLDPFTWRVGMHLVPVAMEADEIRDFYEGFSNSTLWPLYHDVIAAPAFHCDWWAAYRRVNRRFAESAAACAAPGATVWVHDYQLQLVPAMLRQLRPDVRIGWFNHIPFPPEGLFAQLPWREELLRGLLGADVVGFQRESDASNFAATCCQFLGVTSTGGTIEWSDPPDGTERSSLRTVRVVTEPISTDATELRDLALTQQVTDRAREIRKNLGDPETLILGVDRLDYTKGIRHRLRAIEALFADGALVAGRDAFVQVATPSRDRVAAYRDLRHEIESMVGSINGDHGSLGAPAIHYLHQSHSRDEVAALFLAADVMVVTPLRDGMNLVAKEFVACGGDDSGALVLSEFAGAADELDSAYLCNPHDISGLKRTILRAIRDTPRTKRERMRALRRRVETHDVHAWAGQFLSLLEGKAVHAHD